MEFQSCSLMKSRGSLMFLPKSIENHGICNLFNLQTNKTTSAHCSKLSLKISSSFRNSQGPVLKTDSSPAAVDECLILKSKLQNKSLQIESHLNGRCIYLVGMMGSGKTTIGRLLAEVLGYSFFDIDSLVETLEEMSVADIFKQRGEGFFRDKEATLVTSHEKDSGEKAYLQQLTATEVLQKVSMEHHLVISTGGGAVIRPINWKHMRSGISVWLDVPIECLARRISAVGTGSRPLLHGEAGDAYTKAYSRLSKLFEERHEAYVNAKAHVSLDNIATKLGYVDVDNLSPTVIAIEVLEQIESFLRNDDPAI